jgi:hypothetical protein
LSRPRRLRRHEQLNGGTFFSNEGHGGMKDTGSPIKELVK